MIIDALLAIFEQIFRGIASLLPSLTNPCEDECVASAEWLGGQVGFLDGLFPVSEIAEFLQWAIALFVLPIYFPFMLARWVGSHFPYIKDLFG